MRWLLSIARMTTLIRGSARLLPALALALMLHGPARGQSVIGSHGDWVVLADEMMTLALTLGEAETAFGLVCGPECFFYIESDQPCADGLDYSTVAETTNGGRALTMTCRLVEGRYLLTAPSEDALLRALGECVAVKFVVPGEGGSPNLFRFSLDGGARAMAAAIAANGQRPQPGSGQGG